MLGERHVSIENLDAKFREIAARHLMLLQEATALSDADPHVNALKKDAVAAIQAGEYARAQSLLEQAFDADLVAARKVMDAANRRYLAAAKTKANLGQLKATQLQFADAAQEFLAAADLVPAGDPLIRAEYLTAGGLAATNAMMWLRAESPLTEALRIREELLEPDHANVIDSINNLAWAYTGQYRYAEAETLTKRALAITEKVHGPEHLLIAGYLEFLAGIYSSQGRHGEAELLKKRAFAMWEKLRPTRWRGADDPLMTR